MTAENSPPHPQERPGLMIPLDVSSDCYLLFQDNKFVVKAFRLFHRIPSFGFCIQEHDRPGRLKTELLKELGNGYFTINFWFGPSFEFSSKMQLIARAGRYGLKAILRYNLRHVR